MSRDDPNSTMFDEIDESLRKAYEQLLNEDIPERFLDLIQHLKNTDPEENDSGVMP